MPPDHVHGLRHDDVAVAVTVEIGDMAPDADFVGGPVGCRHYARSAEGAVTAAGEHLERVSTPDDHVDEPVRVHVADAERDCGDAEPPGGEEGAVPAADRHGQFRRGGKRPPGRGNEIGPSITIEVGGPDVDREIGLRCDREVGDRRGLGVGWPGQPGH
jgi:hypothetical protein